MCRVKKYLKTSAGKHLQAVRAMLHFVSLVCFENRFVTAKTVY